MDFLSFFDVVLPPLYLMVIFLVTGFIKSNHIRKEPEYYYYRKAIFIKILGALLFGCVYVYYYRGGDTINYFKTALAIKNLMLTDLDKFSEFYFSNHDQSTIRYFFNDETGYPIFELTDHPSIFTSKCYVPLVLFSGDSFFVATILAAVLSFTGLWRLYKVFVYEFPALRKQLFFSIFAIPSLFFWGSGIMKDSLIVSAVGWYVYAFYWLFIKGYWRFKYVFFILVATWLIIGIKAYVLFALLPGSVIWVSNQYSARFQNKYLRGMFTPIFLLIGFVIAYLVLYQMDDYLGLYNVENVAGRAYEVNADLKKDYYGGKTFDIGEFDPSVTGMMSVAHKAVFAALFRPSILDAQNIVMYLSAVENTYFLIFVILLLFRLRFVNFFRYIWIHPLVLFSILFSLFFAFSVGLSISNFGSLVRLRVPALPFFVSSLVIIQYYYRLNSVRYARVTRKIKPAF